MADNYLENKMEEFRQGTRVVRHQGASLETLLQSAAGAPSSPQADHFVAPPISDGPLPLHPWADMASGEEGAPASGEAGNVMPAQVEAIVRAAKHLREAASFRFEVDETAAVIRILGPSSPRRYMFDAGQVILAMRLKAAELHLHSTVEIRPDSSLASNPLLATVTLSR